MSLKTHTYSILVALVATLLPNLFGLSDNNIWSIIQILGLLFTPGLSFSLFLRKWGKNISDDIVFFISIVFSLAWVMFFVSWNSIRGEQFATDTLLLSSFGAGVIFTALGMLPNGRELNPSEPFKYKIPALVTSLLVLLFGSVSYLISDTSSLSLDPTEPPTHVISLEGRTQNNITLRIYNPEDKIVRTTIYFEEIGSNFATEIFTDILASGENFVTLAMPEADIDECRKYSLVYATSSTVTTYYDDIVLSSAGCYAGEKDLVEQALPTNREELLDFIYKSGLE